MLLRFQSHDVQVHRYDDPELPQAEQNPQQQSQQPHTCTCRIMDICMVTTGLFQELKRQKYQCVESSVKRQLVHTRAHPYAVLSFARQIRCHKSSLEL